MSDVQRALDKQACVDSVFDVTKARSKADWFLEYPDELDKRTLRFAMMMRAACNEIDHLRNQEKLARAVIEASWVLRDVCENWATKLAFGEDLSTDADAAYRRYDRALAAWADHVNSETP